MTCKRYKLYLGGHEGQTDIVCVGFIFVSDRAVCNKIIVMLKAERK